MSQMKFVGAMAARRRRLVSGSCNGALGHWRNWFVVKFLSDHGVVVVMELGGGGAADSWWSLVELYGCGGA